MKEQGPKVLYTSCLRCPWVSVSHADGVPQFLCVPVRCQAIVVKSWGVCVYVDRAAPGQLPLLTKYFLVSMDGLCSAQNVYGGITTSHGYGQSGVYPMVGPITTAVSFSGAAAGCPSFGPSPSPHAPNANVTECWQGAPSSVYAALDQICNSNSLSFSQVRRRPLTLADTQRAAVVAPCCPAHAALLPDRHAWLSVHERRFVLIQFPMPVLTIVPVDCCVGRQLRDDITELLVQVARGAPQAAQGHHHGGDEP
jgi:hypothetical protein